MGIVSEPTKIRTYPPIATVYVEFFCSYVCGPRSPTCPSRESLLQCDPILSCLSEPCITNEPIVNAQELSFLTLLLELIRSVIFLITFFLSVSVTVWPALPDVKVRNREEVKN